MAAGRRHAQRTWTGLRLSVVAQHTTKAVAAWSQDELRGDRQRIEHHLDRSGARHRFCLALVFGPRHGRDGAAHRGGGESELDFRPLAKQLAHMQSQRVSFGFDLRVDPNWKTWTANGGDPSN